jgi:hypothetical protein
VPHFGVAVAEFDINLDDLGVPSQPLLRSPAPPSSSSLRLCVRYN